MHIHFLDCHLLLVLLCHHSSEFRCQGHFEQVHFEKAEHHGRVLPFESPEGLIGDTVVNVVERIRGDGPMILEALFDDPDCPDDPNE